jgi:D-amino-acid dehydrogenase
LAPNTVDQPDILIVGGGVIGVCSAYYLARRGYQVTVIDQGEIGSGSSYGNAGLIVPSHLVPLAAPGALAQGLKWMLDVESPFYIRPRLNKDLITWLWRFRAACREAPLRRALPVMRHLGFASADLYQELIADEHLDCHYQQAGLLMLYRTRHGFEEGEKEARLLQEYDVPLELLTGQEVHEREPAVDSHLQGGIYFFKDAHLDPAMFVQALARRVQAMGGRLRPGTELLGFDNRQGHIAMVRTTRGDIQPQQVVLAAGAWSPGLARALGLHLPIQPAKGYSITMRQLEPGLRIPLLLGEARVAVTPMGPQLRYAGTLELAGMDFSINRRRVDAITRSAAAYLNSSMASLPLLEIWRGMRPCTPDGLPIIGRASSLQNLIVATGHATVGMALGPITGSLVAQLAAGEKPAMDMVPLRLDRF